MKRSRLAPLRAAAILAAVFVALRIVYRIVFGGAGGGGVVLLDLPSIRLSGPFEHITLFGEVTTGGIGNAALSALPFAVLVLAFGVLAVLVDLRALFTRGSIRGPVRTVSRALVVAWATFPALLGAVRRVRVARELRGERGVASLIVPILEQTVERAIVLGASMEVRGFAATRRAQPTCERPATIRAASLGYEGRWSLEDIDLDLSPGTLTLVTGATGSGKTTLIDALSGLLQHVAAGDQTGIVEVAGVDRRLATPRETAGFVGVVSQSVRLSFVAATVADELGFTLAIRNVAPVIVAARVAEVAERLAIAHLLDRDTAALSAGEACLVAIGAAIVEHPVLLLVDEPLADLDEPARERVIDVLDRLAHDAGVCVVVAEHAFGGWGDRVDARLELRGGAMCLSTTSAYPEVEAPQRAPAAVPAPGDVPAAVPLAHVHSLTVTHGALEAVSDASFVLHRGEVVALTGRNGAGKSSLLQAIALAGEGDHVVVEGRRVGTLDRRRRREFVALVPEAFDDLLFATTVEAECRRADRRARRSGTAELFTRLVAAGTADDLGTLLNRHPRDLSAGERLCLVIAIQFSARPRILLIDEPSRGLDAAAASLVGSILLEAAARGAAVVIATHDREFAARYATRTITMEAGRLTAGVGVAS